MPSAIFCRKAAGVCPQAATWCASTTPVGRDTASASSAGSRDICWPSTRSFCSVSIRIAPTMEVAEKEIPDAVLYCTYVHLSRSITLLDSRCLRDRQTLHLHNLQGIGRRTWPRSQPVIEYHAPLMYLFAEVIIANTGYGVSQGDEFQVMRRDDANAMSTCQSVDVSAAANEALPIIRATKNFVNQEAQRYGLLSLTCTQYAVKRRTSA